MHETAIRQPIPKVAAIVINHNNDRDTHNCISKLRKSAYPSLKVYLIDNSRRPSKIFESLMLDYYASTVNRGFAAACNVGIRYAMEQSQDYVWLVNNDLTVESNTLDDVLSSIGDRVDIAFAGPKIVYDREEPGVQYAGGLIRQDDAYWHPRGDFEEDHGQYEIVEETDWVSGACMLVNIKAIANIGLMDEKYFLYYEDIDWCIRAKRNQWKNLYVGTSKVRHKASQSTQGIKQYYYPRAHLMFLAQHYPQFFRRSLVRFYHHSLRPHFMQLSWKSVMYDLRVYGNILIHCLLKRQVGHF